MLVKNETSLACISNSQHKQTGDNMRSIFTLSLFMLTAAALTCTVLACTNKSRCWYRIAGGGGTQYGICRMVDPGPEWKGGTEECRFDTNCPY